MHKEACNLCGCDLATYYQSHSRKVSLSCLRCGEFEMTFEAASAWKAVAGQLTPRQVANITGWMREHQGILLQKEDLDKLRRLQTPSVLSRADKLLQGLNRLSEYAGQQVELQRDSAKYLELMALSFSANEQELEYLADTFLADEKGYIKTLRTSAGVPYAVVVTVQGYSYLEELRGSSRSGSIGFCAMWLDNRLKPVWQDAIHPAILGAGYEPYCSDKHTHNNRTDDVHIAMIRRSRFVIADYTGNRGGVYFEAGFAFGLGIPVIWTCRQGRLNRIHFDAQQYNFITWEDNNLPDFRQRLLNRIEATLGRGPLAD